MSLHDAQRHAEGQQEEAPAEEYLTFPIDGIEVHDFPPPPAWHRTWFGPLPQFHLDAPPWEAMRPETPRHHLVYDAVARALDEGHRQYGHHPRAFIAPEDTPHRRLRFGGVPVVPAVWVRPGFVVVVWDEGETSAAV